MSDFNSNVLSRNLGMDSYSCADGCHASEWTFCAGCRPFRKLIPPNLVTFQKRSGVHCAPKPNGHRIHDAPRPEGTYNEIP